MTIPTLLFSIVLFATVPLFVTLYAVVVSVMRVFISMSFHFIRILS